MTDPTLVTNPDLANQVANLTATMTQISAFLSHVSVGGATAHVLEWAKGKPGVSRWWDVLSGRGKVVVGGILAAAGSLGVSAAFSHDASRDGVYTIVLSGLTVPSIGSHLWSFAQSWIMQQGWYASVIKPKSITGVPPTTAAGAPAHPQTPVPVVEVAPAAKPSDG
jgi:hypothetical protein